MALGLLLGLYLVGRVFQALQGAGQALENAGPAVYVVPLVIGAGYLYLRRMRAQDRDAASAAETARVAAEAEEQRVAEEEAAAARRQALVSRFGEDATRSIEAREVWQGATADMVREALGPPEQVDEKVYKSKTKHVFKYEPLGGNRFAFRVMLEDGVVVGWERS